MKKVIIIVWFFLLILAAGLLLYHRLAGIDTEEEHIHIHVGFKVYKDGKMVDFSGLKYMYERPCTADGEPTEREEDKQMEKAHLHDRTGDVAHIERKGAKWEDLFINLKYSLGDNIIAYSEGKRVDDLLDSEIKPYESVVIFIGKNENQQELLKKAVTRAHIAEEEKKSESCGS